MGGRNLNHSGLQASSSMRQHISAAAIYELLECRLQPVLLRGAWVQEAAHHFPQQGSAAGCNCRVVPSGMTGFKRVLPVCDV